VWGGKTIRDHLIDPYNLGGALAQWVNEFLLKAYVFPGLLKHPWLDSDRQPGSRSVRHLENGGGPFSGGKFEVLQWSIGGSLRVGVRFSMNVK
jgi:hypothetical protein